MQIEYRSADEIIISGYVNAVERDSRVLPKHMATDADGDFIERVKSGAFDEVIRRSADIKLCLNHGRAIGTTQGRTLILKEDNIGLHAAATITDKEVIEYARRGLLTGWSFAFTAPTTSWERNGTYPRRTLEKFGTLPEVSILTETPAYIATSVEVRGDKCTLTERRIVEDKPEITGNLDKMASEYAREVEILELESSL